MDVAEKLISADHATGSTGNFAARAQGQTVNKDIRTVSRDFSK